MLSLKWFFIFVISLTVIISACYKEEFYEGNDIELRFSGDTLTFDTVFTSRGSATRILKVYNDKDKAVRISEIRIASNKNNQFRLNIDGTSASTVKDIEIGPQDSIYIFAETHINPDDPLSVSPFIVTDSIMFRTNENVQKVLLQAWGQNANYINTREIGKLSCNLGEIVWDDPKPYIIYGILRIDSCTLTFPPGTKVHMHGGINKDNKGNFYYDGNIYVYKKGRLNIEGSAEKPVIIQTDRLENEYQDINAQWYGIFILPESKGNKIQHAEIKNATIALYVDSLATLDLKYTKILHAGAWGLYSRHATVNAENCLFADIGSYNVIVDYGGSLNMTYCTIYNNNSDDALVLKNYRCLDKNCSSVDPYPLNAKLVNSIIYGTSKDELLLSDGYNSDASFFKYSFENCLVQVQDLLKPNQFPYFFDNCTLCLNGQGEKDLFLNIEKYDYRPDTMAIVIDKGKYISGINRDIDFNLRDANPDIGCYEFLK
jgi:hypothetical protein